MKSELEELRHARSAKEYPEITLENDEYVILNIERSKIGIIMIWAMVALCIIALSVVLIMFGSNFASNTLFQLNEQALGYLRLLIFATYILIFVAGYVGQSIYKANRMYITNRRAIQKIRSSLFVNSTNVIELKRIEDVSYRQNSLLEHIFHIGTLRMSTVGDETTYTFNMLDTPRDEVSTISHLVHECKGSKEDD